MSADRIATIALCWRIERRDGMTIALTDHDKDLSVGGDTYRAAPGMTPSAIQRGEGLDADTMEAGGALHSDAITEADLVAGRWDGARVVAFAVDWSAGGAPVPLGEGRIGEVGVADGKFAAELAGVAARLERPVTEATSPACRATLGDRRCRVAMAGRRRFARVVACDGTALTLDGVAPAAGADADGRLRWLGGANAGLESAIVASAGTVLTLRVPPSFAVVAGALVEVTEGCDRTIATCAGRFDNAANFRGEPYLPGIDLLTRYPGA
ncbi:hypothetical protein ASG29_00375 [Sphingomonas sp. Leaf412]|uniref:DUF2163 domain-containing protein n=1 Tax=Sphingomonas sp. Leaf412 TaxID=1736370 RepID=UPI0006FEBD93|nr:DUF2163 domain-containing protein [Sphingomonas sp. Leaf412]KQT34665.1 hypothetical protein ASG29_00375 [Sphingomonas sp. Leaf412]